MEPFINEVDIFLSYDGDLESENGDLKTTNGIDFIKRKVHKLLVTEPGDWKLYAKLGAKPTQFTGEPNTRRTGELLKQYLIDKLEVHVIPANIDVRVIPIARDTVKVYIDLLLGEFLLGTIPFSIDFVNGIVYPDYDEEVDTFVSSKLHRFNSSKYLENPNPIWDRIRNQ